MLSMNYGEFAYLPASNERGGILVAAKHQDVVVSDVLVGCYSVTVAVKPATNADTAAPNWWLTAVYGPQEDRDKAIVFQMGQARWADTGTALKSMALARPGPLGIVPVPGTARSHARA